MIETSAEYLLERLTALEGKYLTLLADYGELIHAHEILKEQYEIIGTIKADIEARWRQDMDFISKAFEVHPNLDMDIEANANRTGHRNGPESQESVAGQDDQL